MIRGVIKLSDRGKVRAKPQEPAGRRKKDPGEQAEEKSRGNMKANSGGAPRQEEKRAKTQRVTSRQEKRLSEQAKESKEEPQS